MLPIRKAIIPVAGYGTRFLPATKAMPKEMLPVVDTPIIQYLVEEAVAAGITDVIFVTGRGKRAIEDHFDTSFELEQNLVERDKHDLLALVRPLAALARFTYVRQPMPRGNGDAVLRAAHLIARDEPFAVLFGDDLVAGKQPAIGELMRVFDHYRDPVLALARVRREDLKLYGTIRGVRRARGHWEVREIVEKPRSVARINPPLAVIGRYILTPAILDELERVRKKPAVRHRELGLTDGIAAYLARRPVYGYEVSGTWYDCGSRAGYLKANIAYALRRPELRAGISSFIRRLA